MSEKPEESYHFEIRARKRSKEQMNRYIDNITDQLELFNILIMSQGVATNNFRKSLNELKKEIKNIKETHYK